MAKKKYATGLGGLKVVHSNGDQEFAKTRYHASEPGSYKPPEKMMLGKSETKQVVIPETPDTTAKQDADLTKAAKNDLNKRNLK